MGERGRRARSIWTAVAVAVLGLLVVATVSAGSVIPTPIGDDPYTDGGSGHQHKTQLEPDSFAFGQTIVALTQSGRWFGGGGSSNLVFSTSQNGGRTWTTGGLPGTTVNSGGPWPRISDPSIAFDPQDNVWLALGLGIDAGGNGHILLVNRSTDGGLTWSNPVDAGHSNGGFWDKTWITCDTWAQSPHYGNCYVEFDDNSAGNDMSMVTSTDGGLTWGPPYSRRAARRVSAASRSCSRTGTSSCRTRTTAARRARSGRRTAGRVGATACSSTTSRSTAWPPTSARSRCLRPRSPETARSTSPGRTAGSAPVCSSNDIVYSTSMDGLTWSAVTRIPIDPVTSTVDHFLPGIAVDKNTSGSSTHVAVAYYYFPIAACSTNTCDMTVGFTSSLDGGASWTPGFKVGGPFKVPWIANTNQGYMVGDYISTSFTGDGKAHPVFSFAKAPDSGVNGSCYPNNSGCHQRLTSATFDITLPPPRPRVKTRREPIARGLHRHPEDAPLNLPTAN